LTATNTPEIAGVAAKPPAGDRPALSLNLAPDEIRSVIIGLMLAILLGALDSTIVSVALPRMASDLQGFSLLAWVVSGYLVASTVVTPIYGRLGDLFGRRVMLSAAIVIFLLSSGACAMATSMPMLVAARVLQGLGGGGLISTSQAIIADVVALRERGRYQGYISGVFAISSVMGPVVGGFLTHYLSWRWCFWINLPLGVAAFLASRRALVRLPVPGVKRRIDYAGALLLCAGLTALLLSITRIGQGVSLSDQTNLTLFGAAVLILIGFVFFERRVLEPIVPLDLFRIGTVAIGCAILFIGFFNLVSMSVLVPLRFQLVSHASADQAALRLVPLSLGVPIGAFIAGRLMTKFGRYRPIQLVGTAVVPLTLVAIAELDPSQVFATGLVMALAGLGVGIQFPTSLVAVQNAVPQSSIGIVTAATAFFRSLGGAIGIAVLSTVLFATLETSSLGSHLAGGDMVHALLAASGASSDSAASMHRLAEHAFTRIFLVGACVAVVSFLLTLRLPDVTLRSRSK
jgi:EmrB/QacA subfamily drug resistance transporter